MDSRISRALPPSVDRSGSGYTTLADGGRSSILGQRRAPLTAANARRAVELYVREALSCEAVAAVLSRELGRKVSRSWVARRVREAGVMRRRGVTNLVTYRLRGGVHWERKRRDRIASLVSLLASGLTWTQAAERLGIGRGTVRNWLRSVELSPRRKSA